MRLLAVSEPDKLLPAAYEKHVEDKKMVKYIANFLLNILGFWN